MSHFLGIAIPPHVAQLLNGVLHQYSPVVAQTVPAAKWHITLLWLGSAHQLPLEKFMTSMPQTFLPTVRTLYVGRGQKQRHVWAYIEPSAVLLHMRQELCERLQALGLVLPAQAHEFVPHIHLADLHATVAALDIADTPVTASFAAREIVLWQSEGGQEVPYQRRGSIALR